MDIKANLEKLKLKAQEVVDKGKEQVKKVGAVFQKYPEIVPLCISVGVSVIGGVAGIAKTNADKQREGCRIESEVSGQTYLTTHPLSNHEIMELDRRMINGETTGEALDNMQVLRKEKKRK